MTIDIDEYQALKRKAEKSKSDVARAEGALEQQMKKLKDDFDCESIEDAEYLLDTLEKEEEKAEQQYEKELAIFNEKWGDQL